ncbi:MAG: chorismate-binding protein [Actinomycetaceae bacterium]|nr:chorismate-binding protein [Actinomycetaceae bacterium]
MVHVYVHVEKISVDAFQAFAALQADYTDQFVYAKKDEPYRFFGLGRCIAVDDPRDVHMCYEDVTVDVPRVHMFRFQRFDEQNGHVHDVLHSIFPHLNFLIPEIVVYEDEAGVFLQVNSLGPVNPVRVRRFIEKIDAYCMPPVGSLCIEVEQGDRNDFRDVVYRGLEHIRQGRLKKIVLSRRKAVRVVGSFSSVDVVRALFDSSLKGTVVMYRYDDVFFVSCTPELLLSTQGDNLESMCLAGSSFVGGGLLEDEKNRREHEYVVDFIRHTLQCRCINVDVPNEPSLLTLPHIEHLCTPVKAKMMEGVCGWDIAAYLHPTPALAGTPVGEAIVAIRDIENFDRGFFGGIAGIVRYTDDVLHADQIETHFSVTIRSGVFDSSKGYVYAGCGIVEGSDADAEYVETENKMGTILSIFDMSKS